MGYFTRSNFHGFTLNFKIAISDNTLSSFAYQGTLEKSIEFETTTFIWNEKLLFAWNLDKINNAEYMMCIYNTKYCYTIILSIDMKINVVVSDTRIFLNTS